MICCVRDCKAQIDKHHIACRDHWINLPERVKTAVNERLYGWRSRGEATAFLQGYYKQFEKRAAQDAAQKVSQ